MHGTTITEDISPECTENPDIHRLYALWQIGHPTSGLPSLSSLEVEELWCFNDLMLVEQTAPGEFEYLRYGANILLASGFDMTGRRTSDFKSDIGDFFAQCYQRCIEEGQALYTTNPAAHAALVTGWERLLLPLCDDQGSPRYVLGYNRPLSFKHELLAHVLDATSDIIIALDRTPPDDAPELDFLVLSINAAAEKFFGHRRADVVGHLLSTVAPHWHTSTLGRALVDSLRRGVRSQFEWDCVQDGTPCWYRVAVNPFSEGTVITMSDITELKDKEHALGELNRDLGRLANTDSLTGASNRRHFLAAAEAETERAQRYGLPLAMIALDVDRFKHLNDRFGHATGDVALKELVQRLNGKLRANDTLGRLGGEEFSILLPHTGELEAYELAQRLCADIAAHSIEVQEESQEIDIHVTCSFGVAEFSSDETLSALLARADKALYRAKRMGRNRVERAVQ